MKGWDKLFVGQLNTWASRFQWRYADLGLRYWHWGSMETPVATSLELMSYIRCGQWTINWHK